MIGGLVPCSFVDYPGLLAAVVFTRGCNLRCPYCHNPGLVYGSVPAAMGEDDVLRLLERRRGLLDAVVVSGGEPTLHPGLVEFVGAIRRLGFRVKLDTNGTKPHVLRSLLEKGTLDYVALDIKDMWEGYTGLGASGEDASGVAESLRTLVVSGTDHEVRTTVVFPHHDRACLDRVAGQLRGVRRWVLQPFRDGECLEPSSARRGPTRCELSELASSLSERHGLPCIARGASGWPRAAGLPSATTISGRATEAA